MANKLQKYFCLSNIVTNGYIRAYGEIILLEHRLNKVPSDFFGKQDG